MELRALGDPSLELEVLSAVEPSAESLTYTPQWRLLADSVEAAYPGTFTVPYVSLGGADARCFQPATPGATYRLTPLRTSAAQRCGVHGLDEHLTVDALLRAESFYRCLIRSLP